jgi:hypothetical protein
MNLISRRSGPGWKFPAFLAGIGALLSPALVFAGDFTASIPDFTDLKADIVLAVIAVLGVLTVMFGGKIIMGFFRR